MFARPDSDSWTARRGVDVDCEALWPEACHHPLASLASSRALSLIGKYHFLALLFSGAIRLARFSDSFRSAASSFADLVGLAQILALGDTPLDRSSSFSELLPLPAPS